MADTRFECSYAKLATSTCRKCKQKIEKGSLRIAKVVPNPFTNAGGDMKQYHHPKCLFEGFVRARATTAIIQEPDDVHGYEELAEDDQTTINKLIDDLTEKRNKTGKKNTPKKPKNDQSSSSKKPLKNDSAVPKPASKQAAVNDDPDWGSEDDEELLAHDSFSAPSTSSAAATSKATGISSSVASSSSSAAAANKGSSEAAERDNSFREFRKLCANIAEESSNKGKTEIVAKYLTNGSTGEGFSGDTFLVLKLLLPNVIKIVYNLHDKQLVKHFSVIFGTDLDEMTEDLEQGDVAETVALFFEKSKKCPPLKRANLSIQDVDNLLDELSQSSKDDDQIHCLSSIAKQCTANDLKMVIRLIKHDLRINAGARIILDALDNNAYEAFMASRDLRAIVERVKKAKEVTDSSKGALAKNVSIKSSLLTPIQPMLAEACRSVDQAFRRCPNGMYAEIKYDGERVQLHKKGNTFQYFSRSLKPVVAHKVQHLKDFIPKAFPGGQDLILDCEILMVDNKTSKPLPFGTLGIHKKTQFKDASVCLFVFDCLHFNGESLLDKPIKQRKEVMKQNMKEINNRVLFSEIRIIKKKDDLTDLMTTVFKQGLEGLVLKDLEGVYEPGKRHWLKVKKDYLAEGAMADTADLVVLGAYYGTGNKGGMMSVFLMGVYDPDSFRWCTVTKCGNGFDDKMLKKLQTQLDVTKISKDPAKVPSWLKVTKTLVPDFVVNNPKKSQVWEITGAEFSKSDVHTAAGISIRFPRFTRLRDDKSVKDATDLPQLLKLFACSKERSDIPDCLAKNKKTKKGASNEDDNDDDEDGGATDEDPANCDDDDVGMKADQQAGRSGNDSSPLGKRKADENEGPPAKRASIELPACKYGANCYQQNAEHRARFSHPDPGCRSTNALANVFSGCKFFVPDSIYDNARMKRFIIAFDGDVLNKYEKQFATHIVVASAEEADNDASGHSVPASYVWQCIKSKTLLKRDGSDS